MTPASVRGLAGYLVLFKSAKDIADLETFLQAVILIRVDQLKVFATIEDGSMALVVRLPVPEDWVARELNPEVGLPVYGLNVKLGVAVDQRGEKSLGSPPLGWFLEVCDLELGVRAGKELGVPVFLLVELLSSDGNDGLEHSLRHQRSSFRSLQKFGQPWSF